jgi:hypothetical protein
MSIISGTVDEFLFTISYLSANWLHRWIPPPIAPANHVMVLS